MGVKDITTDALDDPAYVRRRILGLRRARERLVRQLRDVEAKLAELEEAEWVLKGRELLRGRGGAGVGARRAGPASSSCSTRGHDHRGDP